MKRIIIGSLIVLLIIFLGLTFGYFAVNNKVYEPREQTFKARIREINGNVIKVKGINSNIPDFRNKWFVIPLDKTKIQWKNEEIIINNLNVGDNVLITFKGEPTEKYPKTINNVYLMELLEENKNRNLIKINGILYYDTKKVTTEKIDRIDGIVINIIDKNKIPIDNYTANFGFNLEYKFLDDSLLVKYDNNWHIFLIK